MAAVAAQQKEPLDCVRRLADIGPVTFLPDIYALTERDECTLEQTTRRHTGARALRVKENFEHSHNYVIFCAIL